VFAPDDVAIIKGEPLNIPRDNVVYEAGLFSGYLSPERCFIAVPRAVTVHVPSDLAGMTLGFYEDRTDGNDEAAVATFCSKVRKEVERQGLFQGHKIQELRELAAKFQWCQSFVGDEEKRVRLKKWISADIETFCRDNPVNKHRLLQKHETGYYIALFAAIRFHPEPRDWELILGIKKDCLPSGFAYFKLLEAVEALKASNNLTRDQLNRSKAWLESLGDASPEITARIAKV
jgi:hypothetical protein